MILIFKEMFIMKKGIKALGMNMEAIRGNGMVYEMNK